MTVNRGKKHRYLGMDFDYSKTGVLSISMIKYIEDMIEEFPELITKMSRTPHTDNSFWVHEHFSVKIKRNSFTEWWLSCCF